MIVASSDSRELADLCDRVVGLYRGEVRGEASGAALDAGRCIELAYGRNTGAQSQPAIATEEQS